MENSIISNLKKFVKKILHSVNVETDPTIYVSKVIER
jgi:hypothetical protein